TADRCVHAPNGSLCGNGVIDGACGEICDDGTTTAGEICNNDIDDDGDGFIDCADPDCTSLFVETCANCKPVPPCQPLRNDPALISFGGEEAAATDSDGSEDTTPAAPGQLSFHARLLPTTPMDPLTEPFLVTLSNDNGVIFRADLDPRNLVPDGNRYRYYATDRDAVAR